MNRDEVYKKWMSQKMSNGEFVAGEMTIKKCKQLSDENFEIFFRYVESILDDSAFKQRRSRILHFLLYLSNSEIQFKKITQINIDEYFARCKEKKESDNNILTRVNYLKNLIEYYKEVLENEIDLERYRISKAEIRKKNPMKSLTVKQLEKCREYYKDDFERLYIIEMFYETGITDDELVQLTYDKFDAISQSFEVKGKRIKVSQNLANIIEKIRYSKVFQNNYHVMTLLEHIKVELEEIGIENINPQDLKKTRKTMMFRCPQCDKEYEAIVDNWCAKQFRKNGNFWIVCRICGEEE